MELEHKHIIVRAEVLDPPTDTDFVNKWVEDLVENIGMKILIKPQSVYSNVQGNRGLTCITAIETSHITFHSWDESEHPTIQLDVYTCSTLDIDRVLEALSVFNPTQTDYVVIDRDHLFSIMEKRKIRGN